MVRVLHLVNSALPDVATGYTHRSDVVLRAQQQVGFHPTVAALDLRSRRAGLERVEIRDGIEHHHLSYPSRPRLDGGFEAGMRSVFLQAAARLPGEGARRGKLAVLTRWAAAQLEPLMEAGRFDVLHAHSPFAVAAVAQLLARRYGVPWVYEIRGLWHETAAAQGQIPEGGIRHQLDARAEARMACAAEGCLPIGEALAKEVASWGARVLSVAPNVVDAERFSPGPKDPELLARLGLGSGPIVGYVGSLRPLEGVESCFEGLRGLAEARLLIVGDGPNRGALETMASRQGLADRVVFTGRVPPDQVPDYYRLIDVFWVTRAESTVTRLVTPLKPLEAMATGLPVIASRLPALVELVGRAGERGLTYPPEDPSRLVGLTRGLLDAPERRTALGAAARNWVIEHRSVAALGQAYLSAFGAIRGVGSGG